MFEVSEDLAEKAQNMSDHRLDVGKDYLPDPNSDVDYSRASREIGRRFIQCIYSMAANIEVFGDRGDWPGEGLPVAVKKNGDYDFHNEIYDEIREEMTNILVIVDEGSVDSQYKNFLEDFAEEFYGWVEESDEAEENGFNLENQTVYREIPEIEPEIPPLDGQDT